MSSRASGALSATYLILSGLVQWLLQACGVLVHTVGKAARGTLRLVFGVPSTALAEHAASEAQCSGYCFPHFFIGTL